MTRGFAAIPDAPAATCSPMRRCRPPRRRRPALPPDGDGLVDADIVVADGRIEASPGRQRRRRAAAPRPRRAAWCWPGFVDMHTHLDKGHIWPRRPQSRRHLRWARSRPSAPTARRTGRPTTSRRRMDFALRCAYAHGTRADPHPSRLRSPPQHAISWPVFAEMREPWAGRIELQARRRSFGIDACARRRLARRARRRACARARRRCSAASPSWCPELDRRSTASVARRREPRARPRLPRRRDATTRRRARSAHIADDGAAPRASTGRIVAGHCCSLARAGRSRGRGRRIDARRARPASPSSRCRCATCTCRTAQRRAARPRWRGVTLLHEMTARGVPVAVASDNTRDPFYAYGDLDMLEVLPRGDAHPPSRPSGRRLAARRSSRDAGRRSSAAPTFGRHRGRRPADLVALPRPQLDRAPRAPAVRPDGAARRQADRPHAARLSRTRRPDGESAMTDIAAFRAALDGIAIEDNPAIVQAEEPRLLLVLAGPEAPARPRHRRSRRHARRTRPRWSRVLAACHRASACRSRRAAPAPATTARRCRSSGGVVLEPRRA